MLGTWRIVTTDLWDRSYLDMLQPAFIRFEPTGRGEMRFGCVVATLEADYASDDAEFTWRGSDELDETSGEGFAELEPDGSIAGEITFASGDTASFKAVRAHSSAAC